MSLRSTSTHWGSAAKTFHWVTFLVVVGAFVSVNVAGGFEKETTERATWMMLHKSFGVTALGLVMLGFVERFLGRPVPLGALWQDRLARLVHWAILLMLVGMPAGGLLMAQFAGVEVHIFGLFSIPVLLTPDKELAELVHQGHTQVGAPLLAGLIVIHVLGALWHHWIDRDDTLKRMLPGRRV